jgi:electron transfer flavoprotein beta subunit
MKILVCIKQVPDPERIVVDPGPDGFAALAPFSEFRMNRFDEFAVEEALRIREAFPSVSVDALTVGPERAADVLRRAIGMGADGGVHLLTAAGSDPEPAAVAEWIGRYAADRGYGLLLTGSQSEDGMHGLVGPMAAARLGCPCATQVIESRLAENLSAVRVEREIEGGAREVLRLELPAVLALQPGVNRPRYPSLSNLLRANRQRLDTIDACRLAEPSEPVVRLAMVLPQQSRSVEMLAGTARDKAERFLSILKEKAFIR